MKLSCWVLMPFSPIITYHCYVQARGNNSHTSAQDIMVVFFLYQVSTAIGQCSDAISRLNSPQTLAGGLIIFSCVWYTLEILQGPVVWYHFPCRYLSLVSVLSAYLYYVYHYSWGNDLPQHQGVKVWQPLFSEWSENIITTIKDPKRNVCTEASNVLFVMQQIFVNYLSHLAGDLHTSFTTFPCHDPYHWFAYGNLS